MPPPLVAVGAIARLADDALGRHIDLSDKTATGQFALYDLLRHEQALAVKHQRHGRTEISRILELAQSAYGELVGVLAGRDDERLDAARDSEWTLRDLLRHAIAVELRYAAQVEYAAARSDEDPLGIPDERLPCDRLAPPERDFAVSRNGGFAVVLELLGAARFLTSRRLAEVPDAALDRPSLWGTLEVSVRLRAHQIAAHLTEVVVQSEKMLGSEATGSETRRIVRHLCAMRGAHELSSDPALRADLDRRYRDIAQALA